MLTVSSPEIPKWLLALLNQLYEIEQKLIRHGDPANALRNVTKIKDNLEEGGLFYEDPMGQPFKETRTENLVVVEVNKPIIRGGTRGLSRVVQKGIVVVETKK